MKKIILLSILFFPFLFAQAQVQGKIRSKSEPSRFNWDLGASVGTYGGYSYSEIDLGLNYHFLNYLNWRNVLFSRNGMANVSASGLDSSVRFEFADQSEDKSFAYKLFAGPGIRVSSVASSGVFGEAGALFRIGGLNVGAGVKMLNYSSPGKDPVTGVTQPSSDLTYMIYLSGGG